MLGFLGLALGTRFHTWTSSFPCITHTHTLSFTSQALLAILRSLSVFNFNLELLSLECSVSVNFELRWCVTRAGLSVQRVRCFPCLDLIPYAS